MAPVASALVSSPSMPSTTSEGSDSGHEPYAPVTPEAEPVLSRGRRSKEFRGGGAAVTPKDKALKRARRSEIERKSRLRRLDELNRMRDEIQRLQWTYNNLAQAEDIDHLIEKMAVKDCALSVGARQRVIVRLRFMAQLLSEEHLRLREMLSEHELFQKTIEAMWGFEPSGLTDECAPAAVDDREWVSPTRCFAFLRETYELICRFDESRDFVSTGASFMGWTDRRRIDEESSHLQYGFAKQFPLEHAEVLLNRSWDVFSDEKQWCRLVDPSVSTEYQIIQVINSDLVIVRRRHRHAQHHLVFTTAHVLFRLRTPQGYLLCFRTIPIPEIQAQLAPHEVWFDVLNWTYFNPLLDDDGQRREIGCDVVCGGSLGDVSRVTQEHWMFEIIISVLRWEAICVGPLFLAT
ncbi:hypothetical protein ATCC90586_002129 [Pythium insidiosum]|nr:hypothetical protein ATCC90586_002129 [Pythium insidiosum]